MPHDDHVAEHKANGDFKRWGSRSGKSAEPPAPEPVPEPIPEPDPIVHPGSAGWASTHRNDQEYWIVAAP